MIYSLGPDQVIVLQTNAHPIIHVVVLTFLQDHNTLLYIHNFEEQCMIVELGELINIRYGTVPCRNHVTLQTVFELAA